MTESEKLLNQLAGRLGAKTIHELRQVARAVGVKCPAAGKKDRLVEDCLGIAAGKINPVPKKADGGLVGAPPKSHEYDRQLVTDILACREKLNIVCPAAEEEAESIALTVNSGNAHLLDFTAEGILEKRAELWFMRTGLADTRKDIFVNEKLVNRYGLREGDVLCGRCVREEVDEIAGLATVTSVNGGSPENAPNRKKFDNLIPVYPDKRFVTALGADDVAGRMLDLFAPVGAGQLAFITGDRGSGKTEFLKNVASGIAKNNAEVKLVLLLIDVRAEQAADYKRSFPKAKIFSSALGCDESNHVRCARLASEHAKRLAEQSKDAVIILDGLTELARAYNCSAGRVYTALDTSALNSAKKFVSVARNTQDGGSVTIISSLCTGGDAVDEAVFSGLKGACNMRVEVAEKYSDAPFDIYASYASDDKRLLSESEFKAAVKLRSQGTGDAFLKTRSNKELCALLNDKN